MTPLAYLMRQITGFSQEWRLLSEADKQWYRNAAKEEMQALGIAVATT